MTRPSEELIALANKVVANGIVAQALGRLILQIVEVCAEHEISAVAAARAQAFAECEEIARRIAGVEVDGPEHDIGWHVAGNAIADAIRARVGEK